MSVRLLTGDVRLVLPTLPDNSVDCIVTSPPYYGLRSYLPADHPEKHLEIGSEPTLQEWVDTMVLVFRDVRRVLKPRGTLWLNLGDAYVGDRDPKARQSSVITGKGVNKSAEARKVRPSTDSRRRDRVQVPRSDVPVAGLKPKDMMGQPWRVAFALQADGWWLRSEVIWNKPNPMPESVRDRPTKAHEHVFLLSKSEQYHYDFEAMQEPVSPTTHARMSQDLEQQIGSQRANGGDQSTRNPDGRPMKAGGRSAEAKGLKRPGFGHGYDETPKPRYKTPEGWDTTAGEGGHGTLLERPTSRASKNMGREPGWRKAHEAQPGTKNNGSMDGALAVMPETRNPRTVWTIPTHAFKGAHFATFPPELAARCVRAGCPEGGTVLDPFGGSGTVGLVADRQHKHAILIDIDERNAPMATTRIAGESPLFAQVTS